MRFNDSELDSFNFLAVINTAVERVRQQERALIDDAPENLRSKVECPMQICCQLLAHDLKKDPYFYEKSCSFPRNSNLIFRDIR